ncbi:MAG: hypothetical protein HOP02_09910 [Methylococcaceae bacterium]|nr:hypothetical protein [Methylococcaceae bacterium]
MSDLYDVVVALDRGIADRWKVQTRDDTTHRLNARDIKKILFPLLKQNSDISEKQIQAIVALGEVTNLTADGVAELRLFVGLAEASMKFDGQPLVTPEQLKPVYEALGMAVTSRIRFTSPGTGITYTAGDYAAIITLIEQQKIIVLKYEIGRLANISPKSAEYSSSFNILHIYANPSAKEATGTIVHEATHAIKDWKDVICLVKYAEADAFIAEAIVLDVLGVSIEGDNLLQAALDAAKFVISQKADAKNKEWLSAYNNLVKLISQDEIYKKTAELRKNCRKGEKIQESAVFKPLSTAFDNMWTTVFK